MGRADPDDYVLGESRAAIEISDRQSLQRIVLSMARQSTRTLDLLSRHLDPALYDTAEFVDAVRALALRGRQTRIRLLVVDPGPLVGSNHRLVTLATQLTSFIGIRRAGPEHRSFNEAWLIADNTGYVRRRLGDRYEGNADFAGRRYCSYLTHEFNQLWETAEPDPNLRRLHI